MFFTPTYSKKRQQTFGSIRSMSFQLRLLSIMRKSRKLKIFLTLKVTGVNFNIKSNGLIGMKIESGTILQDLGILQKLLKIFTFGILTNLSLVNQKHTKVRRKEIENFGFFSIRSRDFASK